MSYVLLNNPSYANPAWFYVNRALRIYPVYIAAASLLLVAAFIDRPNFFAAYHDAPAAAWTLLASSSIFISGQDWIMFSGIHSGHLVFFGNFRNFDMPLIKGFLMPPTWTLDVERTFYLVAPFVIRNKKRLLLLLLVLLLCAFYL
jgi:peptidoglycan/LPS O-acetylase OafA/YrhL